MGISDGLQGSGGEVDCSVGTIVWVRRRNGSWWPGRILGPNELSASHLMSPRSGTPVKLLGREDASVDWYNLEKSKRVKAFRCGEFDDCIERAESSQGIPIKKREKYARREDAILHALELEREQLEKKQQKLGIANCTSSKMPMVLKKDLATTSENLGNDHYKILNLKSQSLSKGLDSSLEEESMGNNLYGQKAKHGKQTSLEDDNSEAAIPRMRGLQDFGLRIASKRKFSASVASEGSRRPFSVDNHDLPSGVQSMGGGNHVSNGKHPLAIKRKRREGGIIEESLVKKRDRRRPLVQVLQSSAKLSASHSLQSDGDAVSLSVQGEKEQAGAIFRGKRSRCVYLPESSNCLDHTEFPPDQPQISPSQFGTDNCRLHPVSLMEENTSGLMEEVESDSSLSDFLDSDMNEETAVISDSAQTLRAAGPINSQGQQGSMSSEELDDSAVTGYMSHLHPHDQIADGAADVGVSKWQLKGKRNIRNLLKRPMEMDDGKFSNGSIHGTYLEGKVNNRRALGNGFYRGSEVLSYDYDEDELIDKNPMQTQMLGFGNRRYPSMIKASKDRGRRNTDIVDSEDDSVWESNGLSQVNFRGYWDESGKCFDPMYVGHRLGDGKESMLVDVDLKVQASYQGEHVPLVSLMSRLNGKAIIGHPIQIEALEDGSSDLLHSTNDHFSDEPMDNDGSAALTPVWRTGRRTAMHRIPRPHPSTALDGDEAADSAQNSDPECKPPFKKSHAENFSHKVQPMRKNFTNVHRLPIEKKCPKKPVRKASLSSQKTRTLSSIATEQKLSSKASNPKVLNKSSLGGLIKSEIGPPTVTCIPVKLAFSRLLEAVGRPPSRTANHSVLINSDTERKPS